MLTHAVPSPCHPVMGTGRFWGTEPAGILMTFPTACASKQPWSCWAQQHPRLGFFFFFFGVGTLFPQMPGGVCVESHIATPVTAAGKEKKTQNPHLWVF